MKVTAAIVPISGTPRISAPIVTTDGVEGGDDRHPEEVAAQRPQHPLA